MTSLRSIVALSLAAPATFALPISTAHAASTCQGLPATIEASSGDVDGTSGDDVIVVSGTVRSVQAGAGNDRICVVDATEPGAGQPVIQIGAGAGNDIVDTTGAGVWSMTDLGPGADHFIGGDAVELVEVGGEGDVGPDVVGTGSGRDSLLVRPGAVVSADLGIGGDFLRFDNSYAGPDSSFDLGSGRDRVSFHDDWDIPHSGDTSLVADLAKGTMTWRDVTSELRGADDVWVVARRVVVRGTQKTNKLVAQGCDVTFRGRGGDDSISVFSLAGMPDEQPFGCDRDVRRAFGNAGNDRLSGSKHHEVLIGGPGRDKVDGGSRGDDICVGEIVAGKGCL